MGWGQAWDSVGSERPGFQAWLLHFPAVCPWGSYWAFLCLWLLIQKVGIIIVPTSFGCCKDPWVTYVKSLKQCLAASQHCITINYDSSYPWSGASYTWLVNYLPWETYISAFGMRKHMPHSPWPRLYQPPPLTGNSELRALVCLGSHPQSPGSRVPASAVVDGEAASSLICWNSSLQPRSPHWRCLGSVKWGDSISTPPTWPVWGGFAH